jgi:hypothetical protein
LAQLREQLHEKTQVFIGIATVDRMVRLGWTKKGVAVKQ